MKSNKGGKREGSGRKPGLSQISKTYRTDNDLDLSFDQGKHLIDFLKSHPFLKVNAIEKAAGIPKNVLTQAVRGTRPLPIGYWHPLHGVLIDYGYTINDTVKSDPWVDIELPYKFMEIMNLDDGLHFSHPDLEEVKQYIECIGLILDYVEEEEITRYGAEIVIKSRFLK